MKSHSAVISVSTTQAHSLKLRVAPSPTTQANNLERQTQVDTIIARAGRLAARLTQAQGAQSERV